MLNLYSATYSGIKCSDVKDSYALQTCCDQPNGAFNVPSQWLGFPIEPTFTHTYFDGLKWRADGIKIATGINASQGSILQYVDDGSGPYANALIYSDIIPFAYDYKIYAEVYIESRAGTSPKTIALKLQDGGTNPWERQKVVSYEIPDVNKWMPFIFDFSDMQVDANTGLGKTIVVQFDGEANQDPVTAYISTLQLGTPLTKDPKIPAISKDMGINRYFVLTKFATPDVGLEPHIEFANYGGSPRSIETTFKGEKVIHYTDLSYAFVTQSNSVTTPRVTHVVASILPSEHLTDLKLYPWGNTGIHVEKKVWNNVEHQISNYGMEASNFAISIGSGEIASSADLLVTNVALVSKFIAIPSMIEPWNTVEWGGGMNGYNSTTKEAFTTYGANGFIINLDSRLNMDKDITIAFKASNLKDTDSNVTFVFENAAYPLHEPAVRSAPVTISGLTEKIYTAFIPKDITSPYKTSFQMSLTDGSRIKIDEITFPGTNVLSNIKPPPSPPPHPPPSPGYPLATSVVGSWKIASVPGALAVGPFAGDGSWWSINSADILKRSCYFDDVYMLNEDGTFHVDMTNQTWIETEEKCGTPVAPHDGSNPATFVHDTTADTLSVVGNGAFLGLSKIHNNGELPGTPQQGNTITYSVHKLTTMTMELHIHFIDVTSGVTIWWLFKFEKVV